jgi:hypothetical protein
MEILTNKFKMLFAEQFKAALSESGDSTFHLVGAKSEPFVGTIPNPGAGVYETFYRTHDEILFGKRIQSEDVSFMIRNIPWTTGSKYDMYDDRNDGIQSSSFFVVSDQEDGSYGVFKCLYKNPVSDRQSVYKPSVNQTNPSDEVYITGDGYHWKLMFTIDPITYQKFANVNYVPVTLNATVISSAVSGTIDAVLTEDIGSGYNNYAYGTVKEINYDNSALKYAIKSDDVLVVKTYDLVYASNTTFTEGDVISINVPGQSSVGTTIYKTSALTISVEISANTQNITQSTIVTSNTITVSSNTITADVVAIREENLPTISNNNNFYKNAVFYIRGGTGAGQIRTITDYTIIGNDRVVTIDSAFTNALNLTSTFSILPKITITGDGTGAIALPEINPAANSIYDIVVVNRGSGYSYANATISGNTGIISANGSPIIADNAVLRPTIAPPGGHGSDPLEELYASNIGMSVSFTGSEVLDYVSFSKIALVRNLLQNDVKLTLATLIDGQYTVGEEITQLNEKSRATISEIDAIGNVLTLTDVFGDFVVSANNTISGNTVTTSVVTGVNSSTDLFNNNIALSISPIIGTFTVGETISQTNSNATGIVVKVSPTVINIVKIFGTFTTNISDTIIGDASAARALVTNVGNRRVVDNSGDVIYIENISALDRSGATSENIKIIVKF